MNPIGVPLNGGIETIFYAWDIGGGGGDSGIQDGSFIDLEHSSLPFDVTIVHAPARRQKPKIHPWNHLIFF